MTTQLLDFSINKQLICTIIWTEVKVVPNQSFFPGRKLSIGIENKWRLLTIYLSAVHFRYELPLFCNVKRNCRGVINRGNSSEDMYIPLKLPQSSWQISAANTVSFVRKARPTKTKYRGGRKSANKSRHNKNFHCCRP